MNIKPSLFSLITIISLLALTSACTQESKADSDSDVKTKSKLSFYCGEEENNGEIIPATIVDNPQQDKPLTVIKWNPNNNFFGKDWTPENRCKAVSRRFQIIYNRDNLKYITADVANWVSSRKINVVCSVKAPDTRCEEDDLLFTLESQDDPNEVLQDLIAFRKSPTTKNSITRGEKEPTSFAEGKRVYYDLSSELEKITSDNTLEERSAF